MAAVSQPSLSIVVPAYNESERIADPLRRMDSFLARQAYSSEVLVVDDGSDDATGDVVRGVGKQLSTPLRLIRCEANRGKGHALKVGFAAARGERILFTDADLSTPIEEAPKLLALLDAGAEVAIGSRKMEGANIRVHQPWYRERLGEVYTAIVRLLIANVSDVTCGFKAFEGAAGRDIFSRVRVDDWSFDAEILLIAARRGYRVREAPVEWEDYEGTKVRLLRDVVCCLVDLARIRLNAARGRYTEPVAAGRASEVWARGVLPGRASYE